VKKRTLKNPPLVEAIFELRWELHEELPTGERIDPYYKVLIGGIFNKLREEYGYPEPLGTADVPERFCQYIVQHRFRKSKDGWPLIQIGPGVITLNETAGYTWNDFQERACCLVAALFETHPKSKGLAIDQLVLRYINGIEFDYEEMDIFGFLGEQMKTELGMYGELFQGTRVDRTPRGLDFRAAFASDLPKGLINFRVARGTRTKDGVQANALIWETIIQSSKVDLPKIQQREFVPTWLEDAHNLAEDWFFKTIEGELERRFD
jgi:uncharacterized protein (TIGR04255 family)